MTEGTVESIEIKGTPAEVFAVAADLAAYTEWATGVKEIEILETDTAGRAHRARFVIDGMVKEITYTLVYSYDEPSSMRWEAEPGPDLKELGLVCLQRSRGWAHRSGVRAQGRAVLHHSGFPSPTG